MGKKKKVKSGASKRLSDKEFEALSLNEALSTENMERLTVAQVERLMAMARQAGMVGSSNLPQGAVPAELTPELEAQIRQMGIDPSSVQVMRVPSGTKHTDEDFVQTVNGPVRWADVPKGEDGSPTQEWIDENCTCADHVAKRAKKSKGGPNDGAEEYGDKMNGGYI